MRLGKVRVETLPWPHPNDYRLQPAGEREPRWRNGFAVRAYGRMVLVFWR